jgi:hypothetical protein
MVFYLFFRSQSPLKPGSLRCILPFSKGFITGGDDDATVCVYERSEDPKEIFKLSKQVRRAAVAYLLSLVDPFTQIC